MSERGHILGIIHISDDPYDEEAEAQGGGEGLTTGPQRGHDTVGAHIFCPYQEKKLSTPAWILEDET